MSETAFEHAGVEPKLVPQGEASIFRRPRVGVVLAAGRSQRLAEVTAGGSKALVRIGGLSLVERAVRGLLIEGMERVLIVVGHHAGPVAAAVHRLAPGRVRTAFAEDWELGNGISLSAAEPHLLGEDVFLLVTTDHLFSKGALTALVRSGVPGVLVDHAPDPDAWAEGTRVRLHEERAVAFSKQLGDPSIDCGAFLLPLDVFDAQQRAAARGDGSLAGAVTELARSQPLAAVPLPNGAWWQDVDTPEDLRRASRMLRRSLRRDSDGPVSRYLNRPLSTRLSMALARLPIHPDAVSIVAFLVALGGAYSLGLGVGMLAALLVHAASVLDGVDGEIARLQLRATAGGAFLDGIVDRLADAAVMGGLAIWALEKTNAEVIAILAVSATAGAVLSMASKDRMLALGIPPAPERWIGFLLGGRDARLMFVAVCALLGRPDVALGLVAATSAISLAVRLLFTRVTLRSWPRPS